MEALWATILFSGFALEVIIRPKIKFVCKLWIKSGNKAGSWQYSFQYPGRAVGSIEEGIFEISDILKNL
jgi:hypothetical protein